MKHLSLSISPLGRITVELQPTTSSDKDENGDRNRDGPRLPEQDGPLDAVARAFDEGTTNGLIYLATAGLSLELPDALDWLRSFSKLFLTYFCSIPNLAELIAEPIKREKGGEKNAVHPLSPPPDFFTADLSDLYESAPPLQGGEYLSVKTLELWWNQLLRDMLNHLKTFPGSVQDYLHSLSPSSDQPWHVVGKVCFHLAENKQSQDHPFAFLATYSHKVSGRGIAQHLPLSRALDEMGGKKAGSNPTLLSHLLKPVQNAAAVSPLVKDLLTSADLFHPLAWNADEAYRFLKEVPQMEASGIVVRVPNWWRAKNPPRPEVRITVGGQKPKGIGFDALLAFDVSLSLGDETLTTKEWQHLLRGTDGLVSLRGQWVEIDRQQLKEVLSHWQKVEKVTGEDGLTFAEALRLLAGASVSPLKPGSTPTRPSNTSTNASPWSHVVAGDWLAKTLAALRNPDSFSDDLKLGALFKATLRPYQSKGLQWLWLLYQLKLGACLADDMGLGKTIQILALLCFKKAHHDKAPNHKGPNHKTPSLLVLPASLMNNWLDEAKRFAPHLQILAAHPSFGFYVEEASSSPPKTFSSDLTKTDLVLTTYGFLAKNPMFTELTWDMVILDEAQAIKNPNTKQTLAVKALRAKHRIALTGTPIENHLSDLWSLFDFLCPGLLGNSKHFGDFLKSKDNPYPALRRLVQPYILRRLKTDRSIIADLPDKTELKTYCSLSKQQAALYQKAVESLANKIESADGIRRRGIILASLMQLKQICNHPSHALGSGDYDPRLSGKFARLTELCEVIAERQEKLLVFTQFRELTNPLSNFLTTIFKKNGLVLSGETPIKQRKKLVDAFQEDGGPPFFVLSLKAGGTGLNLTAASHVIHFDRWWNPAVENQATDRAFRIGQKRSVLVHKFICRGTIEDKIDGMIEQKKQVARDILGSTDNEVNLTDLSNDDLLKMVTLDIRSVESL